MTATFSKRLTTVRDVAAPPSTVWATLAAFDSLADWAPNVDHSALMSEQADGVGAVRRVQSGSVVVVERVATWEAESMLSYAIEGLPPAIAGVTNTWVLRPNDDGTAISLITDIDATKTPLGFVAGRTVARQLRRAADEMLAGIAEHTQGTS